jgi:hypothetical protein
MIMPKPGEARQATMKTMVIPAPKTGMPVSTFLLLVFVNDLVTAEVGRFFSVYQRSSQYPEIRQEAYVLDRLPANDKISFDT